MQGARDQRTTHVPLSADRRSEGFVDWVARQPRLAVICALAIAAWAVVWVVVWAVLELVGG